MQHLLAQPGATHTERQAYLQGVDGFPGPVDRWLIANSRTPRINFLDNYLMLDDPSCEYVTCIVEPRREITQSTDDKPVLEVHTLYLTATVSPKARANLFFRKSPQVIIDRFSGSNQEALAPLWTKWNKHWQFLEFQQPLATFAKLFTKMASWDFNKDQPGLPIRMAQWSRSVIMSTHGLSTTFTPIVTPEKSSPSLRLRSRRKKRRSSATSTDVDSSPSEKARKRRRTLSHRSMTIVNPQNQDSSDRF